MYTERSEKFTLEKSKPRQALIDLIGVPVKQKTIQVGAVKTAYIEAGNGPPLILLHGSGIGGMAWYRVMGTLSAHFRTIVPDIVGFGESGRPAVQYDRHFFATWLRDFLNVMDIDKPNLVGHSLGGAIALQMTLENPERVERLTLINSVGLFMGKLVPGSILASLSNGIFRSPVTRRWARHYSMATTKDVDQAMIDYDHQLMKGKMSRYRFWLGVGRTALPFSRARLSSITRPTLMVWGDRDPVLPLINARFAQGLISGAQLRVISHASHDPHLDQPKPVAEAIIQFLKLSPHTLPG